MLQLVFASLTPTCRRASASPPPQRLLALLALLAFVALMTSSVATQAFASGKEISADDLGFDVPVAVAEAGRGHPMVSFTAAVALKGVVMMLKRSDGKSSTVKVGNLVAGREKRVKITQEKGAFSYVASLSGRAPGGAFGPFELLFDLKVGAPPRIAIASSDVDLDAGQITIRLSEPKGHVELMVWDSKGDEMEPVTQPYATPPGTPIAIKWKQKPGQVAGKFALKAYDVAAFWSGVESVTFVDIPHEDIAFESGKWEIRASEVDKLEAPLARIAAEIEKVAGVLPISLYVAGYTDTVGSEADNIELSRQRAATIAAWFKKRGLRIPILAQGFGEGALTVPTPDNQDEPRNRRAAYVLSATLPPLTAGFPGRAWKRM